MLGSRHRHIEATRTWTEDRVFEYLSTRFSPEVNDVHSSTEGLGIQVIGVPAGSVERLVTLTLEETDQWFLNLNVDHDVDVKSRSADAVGSQPETANNSERLVAAGKEPPQHSEDVGEVHGIHATPALWRG